MTKNFQNFLKREQSRIKNFHSNVFYLFFRSSAPFGNSQKLTAMLKYKTEPWACLQGKHSIQNDCRKTPCRENAFLSSNIPDTMAALSDKVPGNRAACRREKSRSRGDLNLSFRFIRPHSPAIDFARTRFQPRARFPAPSWSPPHRRHPPLWLWF